MPSPDTGNPNFFKVFKGRYAVAAPSPSAPEPHVMLSCVNDVQFLCDFTADASGLVLTLPEDCRPSSEVWLPASAETPPARRAGGTVELEYAVLTGTKREKVFRKPMDVVSPPAASGGMSAEAYDGYATNASSAVSASAPDTIEVPIVEMRGIEIGGGGGSQGTYLKVEPSGKVIGAPLAKYRLNGLSFHISGNYYA